MPTFKDNSGREWKVFLNVGMIEDIKEQTEIDLDYMIQHPDKMSEVVFVSPRKMVEMLYVICKEQVEAVPLTPREFASIFDRVVLDNASNAMLEAVMLFYPRSSAGKVIAENLPRMITVMDEKIAKDTQTKVDKALSSIATD